MQSKPAASQNKQFSLGRKIHAQYICRYFDLYENDIKNALCYVANSNLNHQNFKDVLRRIGECWRCLQDGEGFGGSGLAKVSNKVDILIGSKQVIGLTFAWIDPEKSIKHWNKPNFSQILDLSSFLIMMILKIKQCNGYFGSFHPNNIFQKQQGFIIIGGDLFSKKCTSKQFKNINQEIWKQMNINWKYQCPEIYQETQTLDYSSDLFIVGCILYELITGEYPFPSKTALVTCEKPTKFKYSQITKYICTNILVPKISRSQPEDLIQVLEMQRGKTMFNTCKLSLGAVDQTSKSSFFDNFQEFILKKTTQTEGWFLIFCENTPNRSDNKYLQQILHKIGRKNQKITKLITLFEKTSVKSFKDESSKNSTDDNTYSILKMGIMVMNLLRKMPLQVIEDFHGCFTKISSQIIGKKPANYITSIIFKTVAFKISLQSKFRQLAGNFYLKIQNFLKLSVECLQYLCQYTLKLLNYLLCINQQANLQNLAECEKFALINLCDELYDAVSILLYSLIAIKKDHLLKISQRLDIPQLTFKKMDTVCSQIVSGIAKLCGLGSVFCDHQIYSIASDYYEYQEDLCLMYCPIDTSFEYFLFDKNQYKGLSIPQDYTKVYSFKNNFDDFQDTSKYEHRKPIMNRMMNEEQGKAKESKVAFSQFETEQKKNHNFPKQQNNSSSHSQPPKSQTSKTLPYQNDFQSFMTNVKSNANVKQSNQSNLTNATSTTGGSKNNESLQSFEQSWLQSSGQDMFSYEWLKKTEKKNNKIKFEKPEVDSIIYLVYEQVCKGLRLQELIMLLGKNKKFIVNPNQVLFQKVIGSGSAGQVYIGKYQETIVAIKKVKTVSNPNALKEFEREVVTYIKIKAHPCLVSLVGLTKYNDDYFLLTEFCQGGSLFDILHKKVNDIPLSWKERVSIALDIAKGLEFLHKMNPPVIHRDLKSLNVFMIKKNNTWAAKVADFGLSRSPDAGMMTSALGTLHWMAPELLSNKQYSLKVDVYSFGIVLWQICSRRTPYHNLPNQMAIVKHVVLEKGRPLMELINADCPSELINLMQKCWNEEPENRPYFPQIVGAIAKICL